MAEEMHRMSSRGNMEGSGCTEEAKRMGMNFSIFKVTHKGLSAPSILRQEVGANEAEGIERTCRSRSFD